MGVKRRVVVVVQSAHLPTPGGNLRTPDPDEVVVVGVEPELPPLDVPPEELPLPPPLPPNWLPELVVVDLVPLEPPPPHPASTRPAASTSAVSPRIPKDRRMIARIACTPRPW